MAFQNDSIFWVELEKIIPNPYQPRREFDVSKLEELADSIRMYGVLQPLTVTRREIQRDNGAFHTEYELIAGERRLRASKIAGISLIPVIIRDGESNEQEKLELAIIENLQREDLNAVDRALAFKQLADTFDLTHTQVAKKVGRSREYVANSVRLLALPEAVLNALRTADLSEGHARTLLMLNDKPEEQDTLFREILLKKLSVREVERIARSIATDKVRKRDKNYDPELVEMEKQFTETLGTRVHIQKTEFGGKVTIDYFSSEDLAYMLERMRQEDAANQTGRRPFSPPGEAVSDAANDDSQLESVTDATPLSALIAKLQQAESGDVDWNETPPNAPVSPSAEATAPAERATPAPDHPVAPTPAPAPETATSQQFSDRVVSEAVERPAAPHQSDQPVDPAFTGAAPASTDSATPTGSEAIPTSATEQLAQSPAAHEPQYQEAVIRVITTNAPVSPVPHAAPRRSDVSERATPAPSTGPRIVSVFRDRTTAMYVASAPLTNEAVTPDDTTGTTTAEAPASEPTVTSPTPEPSEDDSDLYSIRNFSV